MKKAVLFCLLFALVFVCAIPNAFAAPTINISAVKTDVMPDYDSNMSSTSGTIVPLSSTTYYPSYPKPTTDVYLKVSSSGTLQYPFYLMDSDQVIPFTTVSTTYGTTRIDIIKVQASKLSNGTTVTNPPSGEPYHITSSLNIRSWTTGAVKVESPQLRIRWLLN